MAHMALTNKNLIDDEQVVLQLRSHAKALLWPFVVFILLVAAAIVTFWLSGRGTLSDMVTWVVLGAIVLLAIIFVFWPWLNWRLSSYTVTTQRVSERSGVFRRVGRDIPLYRINSISIEKDFTDRILGCGTLIIADASEKGGMVLDDVPRVESVHKRLQDLLWQHDDGSDDGEFPPGEPRRGRR
jgi:uncharacterized membrane protein YdbT with pleckstrin-like domain